MVDCKPYKKINRFEVKPDANTCVFTFFPKELLPNPINGPRHIIIIVDVHSYKPSLLSRARAAQSPFFLDGRIITVIAL